MAIGLRSQVRGNMGDRSNVGDPLEGRMAPGRVYDTWKGEWHSPLRSGASQFCKSSLIPQPLLPRREKGSRIGSPSPKEGEEFRVRATKVPFAPTIDRPPHFTSFSFGLIISSNFCPSGNSRKTRSPRFNPSKI